MTTKTSNFLNGLKTFLFQTAFKAFVAWLIPSIPAIVALVQKNYGETVGTEVAAILTAIGVYKASNSK